MEVLLQYWEESERGWGVRPDGCSLHINKDSYESYINSVYENRTDIVPDEYERVIGSYINIIVSESIYNKVLENGNIRLSEVELNNIIKLKEIILSSVQL